MEVRALAVTFLPCQFRVSSGGVPALQSVRAGTLEARNSAWFFEWENLPPRRRSHPRGRHGGPCRSPPHQCHPPRTCASHRVERPGHSRFGAVQRRQFTSTAQRSFPRRCESSQDYAVRCHRGNLGLHDDWAYQPQPLRQIFLGFLVDLCSPGVPWNSLWAEAPLSSDLAPLRPLPPPVAPPRAAITPAPLFFIGLGTITTRSVRTASCYQTHNCPHSRKDREPKSRLERKCSPPEPERTVYFKPVCIWNTPTNIQLILIPF